MKSKILIILVILLTVTLILTACSENTSSNDSNTSNNSESSKSNSVSKNESSSSSSKNLDPVWSEDIPESIPVLQNSTSCSVKNIAGTICIEAGCDEVSGFNEYLTKLSSEGWKEEWKKNENEAFYSKDGELIVMIYNPSLQSLSLEVSEGDTANFLISNIDTFKAQAQQKEDELNKPQATAGYQIKATLTLEISDDKYLEDAKAFTDDVLAILHEMQENVNTTTNNKAKLEDLQGKISYYLDGIVAYYGIIDQGGYKNLMSGELFPKSEQPDKFRNKLQTLKEAMESLIGDYNNAYKYNE